MQDAAIGMIGKGLSMMGFGEEARASLTELLVKGYFRVCDTEKRVTDLQKQVAGLEAQLAGLNRNLVALLAPAPAAQAPALSPPAQPSLVRAPGQVG